MQVTDLHIKIQVWYSISYQGRDFICILSVTQKCMRVVEFSAMSKQNFVIWSPIPSESKSKKTNMSQTYTYANNMSGASINNFQHNP